MCFCFVCRASLHALFLSRACAALPCGLLLWGVHLTFERLGHEQSRDLVEARQTRQVHNTRPQVAVGSPSWKQKATGDKRNHERAKTSDKRSC